MLPWIALDEAAIPGGGLLRLMQRGTEFSIRLGTNELMNSRLSGSEEALATGTIARLSAVPAPHLLIGGLGMGFTLRAALAALGPAARVTVSELVPGVVAWARGPLADLFAGSLDDPRVDTALEDVAALIAAGPARYDAILLDVDNGPEGLSRTANDRLYDHTGLGVARAALRPGGVLAIWSTAANERFTRRLRQSGFAVEATTVRASRTGGGARHTIWFAVPVLAP